VRTYCKSFVEVCLSMYNCLYTSKHAQLLPFVLEEIKRLGINLVVAGAHLRRDSPEWKEVAAKISPEEVQYPFFFCQI